MTDHTVSAFDDELREIGRSVAEIGGLAEQMVERAMSALVRLDAELAQRIIADDYKVDRLQHEIEEKAILLIARRQPMARDLREVVAAIRIAADLERVGDLAKNIAKRVIALQGQFQPQSLVHGVEHLAELSLEQLKHVLDAYAGRDTDAAMAVWRRDEEVDALYTSLFRELLTYMMEDPRNIGFCTHLLFCAKNIERIGDHATNIAETVHYQITGVMLTDERPKRDRTVAPADLPQTDD
ncbi:MAG: phosphate signaling complex protein PhoU [Bauldia sp.]|nr:phosphate signaling complex protein PhoU [Bauldia sp.]